MATGSYKHESNWVELTDVAPVKGLITTDFDTRGSATIADGRLHFESNTDSFTTRSGHDRSFFEALHPHLAEELRVRNTFRPPREAEWVGVWVVDPDQPVDDGGVRWERLD
jgi:hypothetical protein